MESSVALRFRAGMWVVGEGWGGLGPCSMLSGEKFPVLH